MCGGAPLPPGLATHLACCPRGCSRRRELCEAWVVPNDLGEAAYRVFSLMLRRSAGALRDAVVGAATVRLGQLLPEGRRHRDALDVVLAEYVHSERVVPGAELVRVVAGLREAAYREGGGRRHLAVVGWVLSQMECGHASAPLRAHVARLPLEERDAFALAVLRLVPAAIERVWDDGRGQRGACDDPLGPVAYAPLRARLVRALEDVLPEGLRSPRAGASSPLLEELVVASCAGADADADVNASPVSAVDTPSTERGRDTGTGPVAALRQRLADHPLRPFEGRPVDMYFAGDDGVDVDPLLLDRRVRTARPTLLSIYTAAMRAARAERKLWSQREQPRVTGHEALGMVSPSLQPVLRGLKTALLRSVPYAGRDRWAAGSLFQLLAEFGEWGVDVGYLDAVEAHVGGCVFQENAGSVGGDVRWMVGGTWSHEGRWQRAIHEGPQTPDEYLRCLERTDTAVETLALTNVLAEAVHRGGAAARERYPVLWKAAVRAGTTALRCDREDPGLQGRRGWTLANVLLAFNRLESLGCFPVDARDPTNVVTQGEADVLARQVCVALQMRLTNPANFRDGSFTAGVQLRHVSGALRSLANIGPPAHKAVGLLHERVAVPLMAGGHAPLALPALAVHLTHIPSGVHLGGVVVRAFVDAVASPAGDKHLRTPQVAAAAALASLLHPGAIDAATRARCRDAAVRCDFARAPAARRLFHDILRACTRGDLWRDAEHTAFVMYLKMVLARHKGAAGPKAAASA